MLRTNRDQVVKSPSRGDQRPIYSNPGKLDSEGRIFVLPGTGGITSSNVKIGDPASAGLSATMWSPVSPPKLR